MAISFRPILPKLAILPRLKREKPAASEGTVVAVVAVRTDLRRVGARRVVVVRKMVVSMYMPTMDRMKRLMSVDRESMHR